MPKIIPVEHIEDISNKVTELTSDVTDEQYPSAKAVYDALQNVAPTHDQEVDQTFDADSENAQSGKAVAEAVASIVNSAPEQLDTINELAAALGNDENFAATITKELSHKADKDTIVGQKTAVGGEIFNDYENNKALTPFSHAEGVQTIAGTYAFNIVSWDETNKAYTLDSIEGLEVNDIFSIKWNTSHINYGKITAIDGNTITVDNIIINAEDFETKKLFIVEKPEIGTEPFDEGAHAEGYDSQAVLYSAHAEGGETKALDRYAHAEGRATQAGYSAHSEGRGTKALGEMSHAEGGYTEALGHYSHAEGYYTKALSIGSGLGASHAEGGETIADGRRSHAEGSKTHTLGYAAHAEGLTTVASGPASHAEGVQTIAGTYAFNIIQAISGDNTYILDSVEGLEIGDVISIKWSNSYINCAKISYIHQESNTVAVDKFITNSDTQSPRKLFVIAKPTIGTEPFDEGAHAEGYKTQAILYASHAEGGETKALDRYAHAEGYATKAYGIRSHAEGIATHANGANSHAEGNQTTASGQSSHAEGELSDSTALASHAEGYDTTASGAASHAEGTRTTASGERAHAEGGETLASGRMSHAEGDHTVAKGESSHAEGKETVASGKYSHSSGRGTKATGEAQTSIGKYKKEDADALCRVGNGTGDSASNRKNAFVVKKDENGNGYAEVQTVGDSDNSITNKKYIKENTQSKILSGEGKPKQDIGVDGDIYIQIIE